MSKIIVGLAGKIACGKGTTSDFIKKNYNAVSFRYSDPLKDVLNIFNLEPSRKNLQTLSTILRQNFSEDILAKAMLKKTQQAANDIVIIDGIRRLTDFVNFQLLNNFYLTYIDTKQNVRFERYTKRNQSPGDDTMSMKDFKEKDEAESEQQIEAVKNKAHFVIDNNQDYDDLHKQIKKIIDKVKK